MAERRRCYECGELPDLEAAIRAHKDTWISANGDRNLELNARPADLQLWAVLDGDEPEVSGV